MNKEFENDPMMKELHRLREEEYKATKDLSFEERESLRMRDINEGIKGTGYKLVALRKGRFKVMKIID